MINNKISVLILRHPQEADVELGTANILTRCLSNVKIVTGLSWPNFEKVLGFKANPKHWGVLYLGSAALPEQQGLYCLDRKGNLIPEDQAIKASLEGIVVLDGTWSQAKSLWWRNAWLLKLQRVALRPFMPSLYGKLRKEPRREGVSSLEAIAGTLIALGEPVETSKVLIKEFRELLESHRKNQSANKVAASEANVTDSEAS